MYLDTRGAGCEGNALCVSASSSRNRDGGSGWWKIVSNSNKVGTVMYGDVRPPLLRRRRRLRV